jgi:hypothetical protein
MGVTDAAGALRDLGLIDYRRGIITIINRAGLERNACECYQVIKDAVEIFTGADKKT